MESANDRNEEDSDASLPPGAVEELTQQATTNTDLFHGVKSSDIASVQYAIQNGANVNCCVSEEEEDTCPLTEAC